MARNELDSRFKIDGKVMPRPDEYHTRPRILTRDSQRLPGNGRLVAPYLGTVWETTWLYKYISRDKYLILYDAYILSCKRNKSIEHEFETVDSNTGEQLIYRMYTQDDFEARLHMVRLLNKETYYRDVLFTFVGVGGDG